MTSKKARTTLYTDEALYEQLKQEAEREGISINFLINDILYEWTREKRFYHYNVYENHITIWDSNIKMLVDVFVVPKNDSTVMLTCDRDLSNDCDHVKFAKKVPKLLEELKKRGLKLAD
jgi:hypothetical protein